MVAVRSGATPRGLERRERILESAARLAAHRGFHSVGVSDIGAAAGVSGAALYRHFTSKTDILVALLQRVVDGLLAGAEEALARPVLPADAMRTLIEKHIDFAIPGRDVLAVYAQEFHHLPSADRRRLRAQQRRYVDIWSAAYRDLHPGTTEPQSRVRVEAVFGLLNSAPDISADIDEAMLREELYRLAVSALL